MNVMTKQMVEKDLTGIWDWMALWPVIWGHMEDSFAAVKEDTRRVVTHLRTNNLRVSVVTLTSQFSWLGA